MRRGLLTKPWAYSGNPDTVHSFAVLTCDMECPDCHACGIVIVDAERGAMKICECIQIEWRTLI